MAIGRYDQRKNYEEAEANAIGTEYLRADLLPANRDRTRELLRQYTDLRIRFYTTRDTDELKQIDADTLACRMRCGSRFRDRHYGGPSSGYYTSGGRDE